MLRCFLQTAFQHCIAFHQPCCNLCDTSAALLKADNACIYQAKEGLVEFASPLGFNNAQWQRYSQGAYCKALLLAGYLCTRSCLCSGM